MDDCLKNCELTVTPIEQCPVCDAEPAAITIEIHGTEGYECTLTPEEASKVWPLVFGKPPGSAPL